MPQHLLTSPVHRAKKQAQNFASSSSTDLSKWLDMVPNGSKILSGLQKYKDVAEKHGHEAEQLAKDTLHDLLQVLDKRSDQLEQVAGKAKGEAEKK